jgi:hypothetical protein
MMRSEARRCDAAQPTSSAHSSENGRDAQEQHSASVSTREARSIDLTHPPPEHLNRRARFSCGCVRFSHDDDAPDGRARALCQKSFLVCTVKKFGDLPGAGSIHVETAIDCSSGTAFAKVYPEKCAMNGVDLLRSRALPYFERRGWNIASVHTLSTSEYFGLSPVQPYEAFLSASRIRHFALSDACPRCRQLCYRFYQMLMKDFFAPALRRNFQVSLSGLQKDLDAFVESHNARPTENKQLSQDNSTPPENFSVHP